jgi:Kdo2-lipid IVA lauroyltransferase/acyltransferase
LSLISAAKVRRAIRAAVGPAFLSLLEASVSRRSWSQVQEMGRQWGDFGFRHHRRYRETALRNITYAFGDDLSPEQALQVTRGCLQHLVMLFLEALKMAGMAHGEFLAVAGLRGTEHLDAALAQGRGAILFSGHHGNWEVGAVRIIYGGYPVIPLSRAARSPRLARAIAAIREKLDFPVIPISEGIRGIMRALKDNQFVPIMPDRYARGQGLTVPFFARPIHVWHTPALMAQRAGCPILPSHAVRQPDGSYVVEISAPIEQSQTGDRDFDVWVTTARTMAFLEADLRARPEQFTWPYHLWRSDLPLPPSPYPFEALEGDPVIAAYQSTWKRT